jgi:hypothetical protein
MVLDDPQLRKVSSHVSHAYGELAEDAAPAL